MSNDEMSNDEMSNDEMSNDGFDSPSVAINQERFRNGPVEGQCVTHELADFLKKPLFEVRFEFS